MPPSKRRRHFLYVSSSLAHSLAVRCQCLDLVIPKPRLPKVLDSYSSEVFTEKSEVYRSNIGRISDWVLFEQLFSYFGGSRYLICHYRVLILKKFIPNIIFLN